MGALSAVDEARLNRFVQSACRFARGRPQVLRELARRLGGKATTLEETAESEADTEREQPVDASGSERAEESGDEGGGEADDERGEGEGALSHIPTTPVVTMDTRKWDELLPKVLHDSFAPVVELCVATPDACRQTDNTVKHAMDARDNQACRIGRAGAELCMSPDQLLLVTLPDGRGGVCAAMWAVVEPVQRDRREGPHLKISVVRVVVKPEYRRGDPQLDRRNVKLDLFLAIVDAGLREPCDRVAFTLADADCITTKRGAMWRRLFQAAVDSRAAVGFDAEGLDGGASTGVRGCVAALPCLWASPTGAPPPTRKPKHPADEFCERAEAELAETGAPADATINPLTGECNMLIHPYSQEERAAMAEVDGEADGSGEEMEEGGEESGADEEAGEEAGAEERDQANGGEGGEVECAAENAEAGGGERGEAEGAEAYGGEGGALEPDGSSTVAAVEQPWAPNDTEELIDVIATRDYGVSDDRSSTFATPAIKAYNDELMKANGQSSEHMVAANNAYERNANKKRGDEGWMPPEAAIEAYNEQVRAENAKVAPTAIKAYNGKADIYEQVVQKRGQPLREGFTIVKVRGDLACTSPAISEMCGGRLPVGRLHLACTSPAISELRGGRLAVGRLHLACTSPAISELRGGRLALGRLHLACTSPAISELRGGRLALGRLYLPDTISCLSRSTLFSNLLRPSIAFDRVRSSRASGRHPTGSQIHSRKRSTSWRRLPACSSRRRARWRTASPS